MKAIYKLFALTAALAALAGCDLTMIPEDAVSPESFFHSEVEMQRWLNPLYANVLYDGPTSNNYDNFNADDLIDNYLTLIMLGTRSAADAMTGTNLWSWSALRRVNLFLQYSSNCEDEAVRSRYEGEARVFRAVIYFHKVCNFGDVPWYDHVIGSEDTEDLNAPREDRGIVMRHVMDDFDFAIEKLPVTRNLVRVNRWTALAFKARAALYEGSWRLYRGLPDAEDYLEIARDAAKEVLDCGLYSLYTKGETPYRDLFNADDIDDYRPGMQALKELGIKSPLLEAGLTKTEIRELSKREGLSTWDKPSFACLASRFAYGEIITPQRLNMVSAAEQKLRDLGFGQLRVRMHGSMARIEIMPDEFEKLLQGDTASRIDDYFHSLGFKFAALDLGGYSTGSMNRETK